jgi:hypothetical protein
VKGGPRGQVGPSKGPSAIDFVAIGDVVQEKIPPTRVHLGCIEALVGTEGRISGGLWGAGPSV